MAQPGDLDFFFLCWRLSLRARDTKSRYQEHTEPDHFPSHRFLRRHLRSPLFISDCKTTREALESLRVCRHAECFVFQSQTRWWTTSSACRRHSPDTQLCNDYPSTPAPGSA